ncbi:MAG: TonB-dependent receptor domain-containing protein, partial [Bacteroidota bacterium]
NEQLMTYASASTGFKGGGSNPRPFFATQVQPFNKENVTAYEVGAKSDFLDRKVRLNLSAFLNKFKDIQLTRLTCPEFSCARRPGYSGGPPCVGSRAAAGGLDPERGHRSPDFVPG